MATKTNLLPAHYTKVSEPSFQGRGNHSVSQLEDICEHYKELVHQLRVEKQTLMEISNSSLAACESVLECLDASGNGRNFHAPQLRKAIKLATK